VFTGKMYPPSGGVNLLISWIYGSSNVPGSNLTYFGLLAFDGKSISGTYGVSPSQTVAAWSAKLATAATPPTPTTTPQPTSASTCDVKSLSGAYSFLLTGAVQTEGGPVAVHIVGRISADGAGALAGLEYATAAGTFQKRILTGQYDVSADCTTAIQITDDLGTKSAFVGALSAAGKTLQVIQSDSGAAVSGTGYQQ
jgi:hypothetical protein